MTISGCPAGRSGDTGLPMEASLVFRQSIAPSVRLCKPIPFHDRDRVIAREKACLPQINTYLIPVPASNLMRHHPSMLNQVQNRP